MAQSLDHDYSAEDDYYSAETDYPADNDYPAENDYYSAETYDPAENNFQADYKKGQFSEEKHLPRKKEKQLHRGQPLYQKGKQLHRRQPLYQKGKQLHRCQLGYQIINQLRKGQPLRKIEQQLHKVEQKLKKEEDRLRNYEQLFHKKSQISENRVPKVQASKHQTADIRTPIPQTSKPRTAGSQGVKKNKISDAVRLYPDYGTDSDGYELSLIPLGITVFGLILFFCTSAFYSRFPDWLGIALFGIAFVCCAVYCILNVAYCFSHGRFCCEGLPVLTACLLVFAADYHRAPTVAVLLFVLVKLFESRMAGRIHQRSDRIISTLPDHATVLMPSGEEAPKKPKHLQAGDTVIVRHGEAVPIDGFVTDGMTLLDYSGFSGIQDPFSVGPGSPVRACGINTGGEILVQADRDYPDSTAGKTEAAYKAAISKNTQYMDRTRLIWNILFPAVFGLALVFTVIVPAFSSAHEWKKWMARGAVVLLCGSPFGIMNLLELYLLCSVSRIFETGIILHDGSVLNKLTRLETFACNKTGTVTSGRYSVVEAIPNGYTSDAPPQHDDPALEQLLEVAALAEGVSWHPIALAIKSYCGAPDYLEYDGVTVANEIPGKGIEAFFGSEPVYCGNASLLYEHSINTPVPSTPGTAVHVARNGKYLGYIILNDETRHGNYDALECLRSCGVKNLTLISSDLHSIVRPIASYASFTNVKAELSPEEKKHAVEYLVTVCPQNRYVAYLGSGPDELPAEAAADVSVGAGALWDDKAWNHADLAILSDGITAFPIAVGIAHSSEQYSRLSLYVNAGVRAVVMILGLTGVVRLPVAAAFLAVTAIVSLVLSEKIK